MTGTPTYRNTRSGSNPSNITLLDIKTLIESSKKEILGAVNNEVQKLSDLLGSLTKRIEELENRNHHLEIRCLEMEEKYQKTDNAPHGFSTQTIISSAVREAIDEIQDIDTRKKSVITFGVPEVDDEVPNESRRSQERKNLKEIFDHVDVDGEDIVSCFRIGRRGNKPRPLKVKLKTQETKERLLLNARQLRTFRHDNWENRIFIKPDLTRRQQAIAKELREEVRIRNLNGENLIIRNEKIVSRSSGLQYR